jgi:hypothetical protein
MNWHVIAGKGDDDPKKSVHIFTSREEAVNFIDWIQDFNADLNITMKPHLVDTDVRTDAEYQR